MNLSKTSMKGLGILVSGVLLAGTGVFMINPLIEQRAESLEELKSLKMITETKKENLTRLAAGAVNFEEASQVGSKFLRQIPKSKNIESASRAISEALVPGVSITSFTFSSEEPAKKNELPPVSLQAYTPPTSFAVSDAPAASSSAEVKPSAGSKSTLNRLPMTITVSADSYQKLSSYIDSLAKRDRLLSVISISAKGKDGKVAADIYAYAFIDKTS